MRKIEGEKIYIRTLEMSDAQAVLDLHLRNRDFFKKYITTRSDEFYTLKSQEEGIKRSLIEEERNERYSFGIFKRNEDRLIGNVTLSEILRGPLQSCYIGYYLDREENGKGYMTEAVKLSVKFAFEQLHLHRIEAGVMPHNLGSICVLEKAGFIKEGIARKNVHINGKWEDHQVLAIISEED